MTVAPPQRGQRHYRVTRRVTEGLLVHNARVSTLQMPVGVRRPDAGQVANLDLRGRVILGGHPNRWAKSVVDPLTAGKQAGAVAGESAVIVSSREPAHHARCRAAANHRALPTR
jgi:hypothetical protein